MKSAGLPSWFAIALLAALLGGQHIAAQDNAVQQAEQLRASGDFLEAVRVLRSRVAAAPSDVGARRLLAQTLYWVKDVPGARSAYDAALQFSPTDPALRLEYARMLAETGDRADARRLLAPVRVTPGSQADAASLLGTIAYWDGDLSTAKRLFQEALAANPSQAEAGRQLQEILASTSAWIRVEPTLSHDDQPLDRQGIALEAGGFATPLTRLAVRSQPVRHDDGLLSRRTWVTEGELRHFVPAARVDLEGAAGIVRATDAGRTVQKATARGIVGVRVSSSVKIRGRLERSPYLRTVASLDSLPLTLTAATDLVVDHPKGWLAQASIEHIRYPDDNSANARYGWFLAPLGRTPTITVQGGYGFSRSNTRESRFVLKNASQPFPIGHPQFDTTGAYRPYHTPANVVRHSALGALAARVSPSTMLRLGGSYAFRAKQDVPYLFASGAQIARGFVRTDVTAWDLRASAEVAAGRRVTVSVNTEFGEGAFYRWADASARLTYWFTDRAAVSSAR